MNDPKDARPQDPTPEEGPDQVRTREQLRAFLAQTDQELLGITPQDPQERALIATTQMYTALKKMPYQQAIDQTFVRKFDERDRELIAAGIDPLLMRILDGWRQSAVK